MSCTKSNCKQVHELKEVAKEIKIIHTKYLRNFVDKIHTPVSLSMIRMHSFVHGFFPPLYVIVPES